MNKNVYQEMNIPKDECYTTRCESDKIIEYLLNNNLINKNQIIWLPFDTEKSNIYLTLKSTGFNNLILSNLELGLDFYYYQPNQFDIIITNPPFSNRSNLFKRLLNFGKPFIILQATRMFNNQTVVNILCDKNFKFIMPQCRMNFLTYNEEENIIKSSKNSNAFYSFWLCYGINLENTFNTLENSGREKEVEIYDEKGNAIVDNHFNIFNLLED
jgi:hypothetical protein